MQHVRTWYTDVENGPTDTRYTPPPPTTTTTTTTTAAATIMVAGRPGISRAAANATRVEKLTSSHFEGSRLHHNEEVETVVRELLRTQDSDFCSTPNSPDSDAVFYVYRYVGILQQYQTLEINTSVKNTSMYAFSYI